MVQLHKTILAFLLCSFFLAPLQAGRWTTHFAYNNVTQIAMADDRVYALSDGNLFSVDKQTEDIRVYSRQSGLHETGITRIHYDETGRQLIIAYTNGKVDLLSSRGVKYLGELYDKDMTQRKTIYNVTIIGRTAYLSTHYGIQILDLHENKFTDSYWLRPGGKETPVEDISVSRDSIYAFAADSMFCAALKDNLVDYTVWKRELRSERIVPNAEKGIHYNDGVSDWYAGNAEGIIRVTAVERLTYKPNGPLMNIPYSICAQSDRVMVLAGGRWADRYTRPGNIMKYDGEKWTYISQEYLQSKIGQDALDFMNVIVDPADNNHYFIPSYGTGLYEFRSDSLINHFLPAADNTLTAAAPNNPNYYTRLSCGAYDTDGNLWMINDGRATIIQYELVCLDASGTWHGFQTRDNGDVVGFPTSTGLVIDAVHPNFKWITNGRAGACLYVLDNNGTPWDDSDDRFVMRIAWTDQNGQIYQPNFYYGLMQDAQGRVWMATDVGIGYFTPNIDCFASDAIIRPDMEDKNGGTPLTEQQINAFSQTPDGKIWIGTQQKGVFVLNNEATEIVAQYTPENSAMPSSCVLSLASDENGIVWIGTAEGLVEFDPQGTDEGLHGWESNNDLDLEEGSMQQWKLHLSYSNATEVAATSQYMYAVANGSLFSVDRRDDEIYYWSKATGLNGTTVSHIAYAENAGKLVVAYEDGKIDLIDDDGNVTQMPDISLKAGAIDVTVNSITVGKKCVYLAMPFGIVAISPTKAEVTDTYYIGDNAASVDVQYVLEVGDTLFAFSYNRLYKASLKDNIVDFTFWKNESLPFEKVRQATVWRDEIYAIQNDSLYRKGSGGWQLVRPERIDWMNSNDGKLLLYIAGMGLYRLDEENQLTGICNLYIMNSAIYSHGEYWLCERNWGLICLRTTGDGYFHTEGPNSNFGYSMCAAHNQIYSVIGGRWAGEYGRLAKINIFDGQNWRCYNSDYIYTNTHVTAVDPVSVAVDPNNAGHFFVATYGSGVLEFDGYEIVGQHTTGNSTLLPVTATADPLHYTRTDGSIMDEQGNLWVMNATIIGQPLHILTPDGIWHPLTLQNAGAPLTFTTPSGIWIDRRDSKRKWMFDQRYSQGVILLDDGGTPTFSGDDRCLKRESFTDQNGNMLSPGQFRCFAQDHTNRIWIGTEKGIFTIPSSVDFFTSNACRRIIIPRNDGTGLGDYLLGDEQINCIAVDGGDRIWIGTANSGLYLIEDDTITVAHFTESNSLLPSNGIQSIAIVPTTGEVFVGTDKGIASYRSDASEPSEKMKGAYAFPNPVRPEYGGMISITGLMENTVVNIIDAGGNLVCKTKSHGGIAVWDGKLPNGRRATPGVYTAMCNAKGGHTIVKIMIAR